jgi:putative redox protein
MKITLLGDDRIQVEEDGGPLTVEAESAATGYSPFHMAASGLATCTFSVLASWGTNAGIDPGDLAIEVDWDFVDEPRRVGSYRMVIRWPSLPGNRYAAAARAVEVCPIHATLTHPPDIAVEVA